MNGHSLPRFKTIGIHFAPDADTIMAIALLCEWYPEIFGCPVKFFPAQQMTRAKWEELKSQGILFVDVSGQGIFDHHGQGNGNGGKSAAQLIANWLGLEEPWLKPILDWTNSQDREGTNFNIRVQNGGQGMPAHHLLLTSVIRGSSHVRFNPVTSKATLKQQANAFWHLVNFCRLTIRQMKRCQGQPLKLTPAGIELAQWGLVITVAQYLLTAPPRFFSDFNKALDKINEQISKLAEKGDTEKFDCRQEPGCEPLIQIMSRVNELRSDNPLALNFTLLAAAEELACRQKWSYQFKLMYMAEVWQNVLSLHCDWLNAQRDLRNGNAEKKLYRKRCGNWQVVSITSDASQIAKAARYQNDKYPKADVVITFRSTGHCQITCRSNDGQLISKMEEIAFQLRKAETKRRGRSEPEANFWAKNRLVANWYFADFGGVFNGTLTNPTIPPTKLSGIEIFNIVCKTLKED